VSDNTSRVWLRLKRPEAMHQSLQHRFWALTLRALIMLLFRQLYPDFRQIDSQSEWHYQKLRDEISAFIYELDHDST
jgi:hypothetical protein